MKKIYWQYCCPLCGSFSAFAAQIYQAEDGSYIDLYSRLGFNITNKTRRMGMPKVNLMAGLA